MRAMLLLLLIAAPLQGATVRGRVADEHSVLPGVEVRLTSTTIARQTTTGVNGEYTFANVPPGSYDLAFELAGFTPGKRTLDVYHDEHVVPDEYLRVAEIAETITLACGIPCGGPPSSIWSEPDCEDYNTDSVLIENAQRGDHSAIALLVERHRTATTHQQRNRIAAALLGRVPDDRALWRQLEEHAQTAVSFAEMTEDAREATLTAWCAERQIDPFEYQAVLHLAFQHASEDARAVPLLLRALAAYDLGPISDAMAALARRRDERHFGAIRKALDRHMEEHPWLVYNLALFQSEAADRLAAEYFLDDSAREEYATQREAVAVSTP